MPLKKYKYILGIQSFASHAAGACLVRYTTDGKELDYVAISEERLIRLKYQYVFPVHSIGYCLDYFGLKDLNQVNLLMVDHIRIKRWFNSGPAYNISEYDYLKIKFNIDPKKIRVIGHHLAHAAATYYTSGFNNSAILVVDGNGSDLETTSYFKGNQKKIELMENYKYHGIGACYHIITENILNLGTGGEGKTMGLAPYGKKYKRVLNINAKLDGIKNDFSEFISRMPYSDVLNQIDSENRIYQLRKKYKKCQDKKDLLNPYYSRVAYDVQNETEKVMVHLADDLYQKTGLKNLCISGGVGLNSVSNKIILDRTDFENIFIFPACSDEGIPFGLAIWGYYNCPEVGNFTKKKLIFNNVYTGREYSNKYISQVIKKYKIPHRKSEISQIAKFLADGKIVGWFQGGSEYGPRALGHRSILADSRNFKMKDILNLKVKHREPFRPFAPAVLKENASEYFDLNCESPYMLLIAKVKKPRIVPSITHIDNTARVQTVTKKHNGIFYDLIKEFGKVTGVPCILNTSFNDTDEPIVETPEDAIICFFKNSMDYLVINDYLLVAEDIGKKSSVMEEMIKDREKNIKNRKKRLLNKYFKGYNENEKKYFIQESNKMSEWQAKYKCKYELEKKVLEWAEKKKRILIIGTKKHTAILMKFINGFYLLDVVGFCQYRGKIENNVNVKIPYKKYQPQDLKNIDCDVILVSSYEYNFEICEQLRKEKISKPVYAIYDNSSRNLMDVFIRFPPYKSDNY